ACAGALTTWGAEKDATDRIRVHRVPGGGLQPQVAIDDQGILHLIYFSGDARQGNVFYVKSTDDARTFSQPLQVNSQPGGAIATGQIRGGQLARGKAGRVHVAWNGSGEAQPPGPVNPDSGKSGMPMLYARLAAVAASALVSKTRRDVAQAPGRNP